MKLSILLPTYNRASFLLENLKMLSSYLRRASLINDAEFVISTNCCTDRTDFLVKDFISNNTDITINYFKQNQNIGLEKNALFVLDKAQGDFVMYLGDDDYIEYDYLINALAFLSENEKNSCVIPSIKAISVDGEELGGGRDLKVKSSIHYSGFKNCKRNSWRGHQLSGLFFRREGLLKAYRERKVSNIYLFIFFVGITCLRSNTYHLTSYPVRVTNPGQENKDWGYGNDGLINEVFDNYIKLPLSTFHKTILLLQLYIKQSSRLWMYKREGIKQVITAFFNIWRASNATVLFRILFPFVVVLDVIREIMKKLKSLAVKYLL